MSRLITLAAACALAATAAVTATATPPLPPGYKSCGAVTGPTIRQPWRTSTGIRVVAMHRYGVGGTKALSCTFMRTWVGRIVRESTPPGGLFPHPKGPAGWRCDAAELFKRVATSGFCHDAANRNGFSWGAEP